MTENVDAIEEGGVRNRIVTELLESLAESRKIMLDSNKDLKKRERWTQLHTAPVRYSTQSSVTCR
jgi:hypothetical protein